MATITGFTAERSQEIEDAIIVGASIVSDHLILERNNGSEIDAGFVKGGTVICTSTTRPGAPTDGMKIYETNTQREYTYFGGAWRATNVQKRVTLTGLVNGLPFTADSSYSGLASFGVTFVSAPMVQLTVRVGSNLDIIPNLTAVSTTGFGYRLFTRDLDPVTGLAFIYWMAHGELA